MILRAPSLALSFLLLNVHQFIYIPRALMLKFLVAYMLMKDFVTLVEEEKVIYFPLNTRPRYSYGYSYP